MSERSLFRELRVWQMAMDLVVEIYRVTARFPAEERFGLTSQLRRAAASVPANIAEGNARSTRKDYASFVSIATGSLAETETFLLLAVRLGYLSRAEARPIMSLVAQVGRMLRSLRARLVAPASLIPNPPSPQ
jgi:four helix bundle protein